MIVAVLLPALLATAVQPSPPPSAPITVTAHPWAPFISPMGEPFRAHSASDDTLAEWFRQADRNHDGVLTAAEMIADANRFFGLLDTNRDGQIDPDELVRYEWDIAPEIQVNSRTRRRPGEPASAAVQNDRGDDHERARRQRRSREDASALGLGGALQGAARYGLLNMPEPVAAADSDFNRAISLEEFRQAALARFQVLDTARQRRITLAQLEAIRATALGDRRKRNDKLPDARLGNPLPPGP